MGAQPTPVEYESLAAFRHALDRLLIARDDSARQVGLDGEEYRLLVAIKGHPLPTINWLADHLHTSRAEVLPVLERLVERKLAVRAKDRHDRRRVVVSLTPAGEEWIEMLAEQALVQLATMGPDLMRALRTVVAHALAYVARPLPVRKEDVGDHAWRSTGRNRPI